MTLGGRAVLDHVLDVFLRESAFDGIVVAIAADDRWFFDLEHAADPRVTPIVGGAERSESVLACLQWLQARDKDPESWVFVHDAARPLLSAHELSALLDAVETAECPGLVLGVPAADTLKRCNTLAAPTDVADTVIGETVDRQGLWHAMTPQVFQLGQLSHALSEAHAQQRWVTDESQAMEMLGVYPWLVRGRRSNMKLTYPEDIELMDRLLTPRRRTA